MSNPPPQTVQVPPGLCVVTTFGSITQQTAQCWTDMRAYSQQVGLVNVGWSMVPGALVEKARNDAARAMMAAFEGKAQWVLYVDGDMVFQPDSLHRLLATAYGSCAWADVVGAYCSLKGDVALPTIDTGTGTWESHFPGRGPLEVIRTGGAFLLVKRHVFERLPEPWFRVRAPMRWLDALAEIDSLARCKMDGKNPFTNLPGKPWESLVNVASQDPSAARFVPAEVGEDSGFCDRVRNAGMRIVVDSSIEIGHLDTVVINATKHKEAMDRFKTERLWAVGVA